MSIRLFMDANVPFAITHRLRHAGVEVLTAQEDGSDDWPDDEVLDRSALLHCVVVTQDQDFLAIAAERLREGKPFCGVFFALHDPARNSAYAESLRIYALAGEYEDVANDVIYV